ncbi:MAG: hypothetical protein WDO24_28975 [Pseudomonadota bacterium]
MAAVVIEIAQVSRQVGPARKAAMAAHRRFYSSHPLQPCAAVTVLADGRGRPLLTERVRSRAEVDAIAASSILTANMTAAERRSWRRSAFAALDEAQREHKAASAREVRPAMRRWNRLLRLLRALLVRLAGLRARTLGSALAKLRIAGGDLLPSAAALTDLDLDDERYAVARSALADLGRLDPRIVIPRSPL